MWFKILKYKKHTVRAHRKMQTLVHPEVHEASRKSAHLLKEGDKNADIPLALCLNVLEPALRYE